MDLFATVMHVPQIVLCTVCYSKVNIGKCKQQVTEFLLHMITIKFCMKFLFPDCIIICYNHNHIIKLVKFRRVVLGVWGAVAPAAFRAVYSPVRCVLYIFDFKILFAILFIIICDEIF